MHAFRCLCVCNVSYTHAETQKHTHTHTQSGTWLKTTPQQQNYFLSWWIITTALRRRGSGNHLKSMFDDIGVYGHFPWQTVWFVEGMVRVLHSIPIESPFLLVKSPFLLVKSSHLQNPIMFPCGHLSHVSKRPFQNHSPRQEHGKGFQHRKPKRDWADERLIH